MDLVYLCFPFWGYQAVLLASHSDKRMEKIEITPSNTFPFGMLFVLSVPLRLAIGESDDTTTQEPRLDLGPLMVDCYDRECRDSHSADWPAGLWNAKQ